MTNDRHYDLISIGAHPDDVEVGAGGVLIDAARRGYRCGLVILTQGEMGTGGTPEIRAQEVRDAADILGADILATFDWGDTRLEDSYDHRLDLARVIRAARPKIILAPYPHVGHGRRQSHPDHVAAGVISINATNLAALRKVDLPGEPHLVTRIFHYFLPPQVYPNFVVDITPHFEQWIEALSAHRSQFLNPEKVTGLYRAPDGHGALVWPSGPLQVRSGVLRGGTDSGGGHHDTGGTRPALVGGGSHCLNTASGGNGSVAAPRYLCIGHDSVACRTLWYSTVSFQTPDASQSADHRHAQHPPIDGSTDP